VLESPAPTTLTAVGLLVAFFVLEERLRQGAAAKSFEASTADRGTTSGIVATFGLSLVAMVVSPVLNTLGVAAMPARIGWIGIGLMTIGIGIRIWSSVVLGSSYTRTLRTEEAQTLVRRGPYRVVRHPGYTGSQLMWLGAGLATANAVIAVLIVVTTFLAYRARIVAEEALLRVAFGDEYRDYMRRTWRLIPFVY
jgi:protein-S-isoprenylcysteine O-methyltransferase Ste14